MKLIKNNIKKNKETTTHSMIFALGMVFVFTSFFLFVNKAKADVTFGVPLVASTQLPTAFSNEIKGGFMQVTSLSSMLSVTCERRQEGMLVWVKDATLVGGANVNGTTYKTYQLIGTGLGCIAGAVDPLINLIKITTGTASPGLSSLTAGVWQQASLGGGTGDDGYWTQATGGVYIYNTDNKMVGIRVGGTTGEPLNAPTQDLTLGEDHGDTARGNFATQMRTPIILPADVSINSSVTLGGDLQPGGIHYFRISALDINGGETKGSEIIDCTVPVGTALTCHLSWGAVPGAVGYKIYRKFGISGAWGATNPTLLPITTTSFDAEVPTQFTLPQDPLEASTAFINKISADNTSWFSGGKVAIGKLSSIWLNSSLFNFLVKGGSLFEGDVNVQGQLTLADGTQGSNKILTAVNSTGLAKWSTLNEVLPIATNGQTLKYVCDTDVATTGGQTAGDGTPDTPEVGVTGVIDCAWIANAGGGDGFWAYNSTGNFIKNITTTPVNSNTTVAISSLEGVGSGNGNVLIYGGTPIGGDVCYKQDTGEIGRCGANYTGPTYSVTSVPILSTLNAGCDLPTSVTVNFNASGPIADTTNYVGNDLNGALISPSAVNQSFYTAPILRTLSLGGVTTPDADSDVILASATVTYSHTAPPPPTVTNGTATGSDLIASWQDVKYIAYSLNGSLTSFTSPLSTDLNLENVQTTSTPTNITRPLGTITPMPVGDYYLYYFVPAVTGTNYNYGSTNKACISTTQDGCSISYSNSALQYITTTNIKNYGTTNCSPISYKVYRSTSYYNLQQNYFGVQ